MILEDGEIICDRCNGEGIDPFDYDYKDGNWLWCKKCHGLKKLNWVENILGKPHPNDKSHFLVHSVEIFG